jgi:hypothetical protein
VAQGVGPEFTLQYPKKKETERKKMETVKVQQEVALRMSTIQNFVLDIFYLCLLDNHLILGRQ